MALNHIWFTTDSWSPLANATVLVLNVIYNYCIPDALVTGRFPNFPLPFDALACACGWRDDLRSLEGARAAACGLCGALAAAAALASLPRQRRPARRQPLLPLSRLLGGRVRVGRAAEPVGPLPQAGRGPAVNSVSSHLHL